MKKKGVSPVVATVLLIALVVILGTLIFMWFKGMAKEAVTKFGTENIELACNKVTLDGSYENGELSISNTGNVPIFAMKIKKYSAGGYSTETINDGWPSTGLNPQGAVSIVIDLTGITKVDLIPVLLGQSSSGDKTFSCTSQGVKEVQVNA